MPTVYAGGWTIKKVYQYDPSDMSKVAESADYGDIILALTALGSYVYAGGWTIKIKKVWQNDHSDK